MRKDARDGRSPLPRELERASDRRGMKEEAGRRRKEAAAADNDDSKDGSVAAHERRECVRVCQVKERRDE